MQYIHCGAGTGEGRECEKAYTFCYPPSTSTQVAPPTPSTANTGRWWVALTVNASCSCIYKDPNIAVVAGPRMQRVGGGPEGGEGKRWGEVGRENKRKPCVGHQSKLGSRDRRE